MSSDRSVLSVSALNQIADDLLRTGVGAVWVEGEVSNLKRYASGHQYFTLKDDQASVSCTLFRGNARNATAFADGDRVVVHGRAGIYPARGQFQLIVERLESAGEGRLLLEFQRLKERLRAEGLFDPERKRPLPPMVHRLGVITSPQGDVRHDIARTLARRFPLLLPFRLYPVAVQGTGAAQQIVRALDQAAREAAVDVLILARGGGSLEDLWPFNEEAVARAIAACPIPVVTGIGHETDTTIADYAADLRASTPTAAAETVSPDGAAILRSLDQTAARLGRALGAAIRARRESLAHAAARLARAHPGRRLERHLQWLDDVQRRLEQAISRQTQARRAHLQQLRLRLALHAPRRRVRSLHERFAQLGRRLSQASPARGMPERRQRLESLHARLLREIRNQTRLRAQRLQIARGQLRALDPNAVLQRGYSILWTQDGQVVRAASPDLRATRLRATLAAGQLDLQVMEVHPVRGGKKKPKPARE